MTFGATSGWYLPSWRVRVWRRGFWTVNVAPLQLRSTKPPSSRAPRCDLKELCSLAYAPCPRAEHTVDPPRSVGSRLSV